MPLAKRGTAPVIDKPAEIGAVTTSSVAPAAAVKTAPKQTTGSKTATDTMSKAEWAAKDTRISRQGMFQAALQSVGAQQYNEKGDLEGFLSLVEKIAERGLVFVHKG